MTGVSVDRVLQESRFLSHPLEDPTLQDLRQAILIEEVFGIVLSDEQLTGRDLGDATVLRDLAPAPVLRA